jgi:activator of HSP90 ATPase
MNDMKTKTLRQSVSFSAAPNEVYGLLMDSRKHAGFSGESASISRKVGGKFRCYGGWIEGKNVELVKDRKIVQMWRGKDWPKGHYSKVTFRLSRKGRGTKLEFTQSGLPTSKYKDISEGWREHYWGKMKTYLGE